MKNARKLISIIVTTIMMIIIVSPSVTTEAKVKKTKNYDPYRVVYGEKSRKTIKSKKTDTQGDRLVMNGSQLASSGEGFYYDCALSNPTLDDILPYLTYLFYTEDECLIFPSETNPVDIINAAYEWPSKYGNYRITEMFYPGMSIFQMGVFTFTNSAGDHLGSTKYHEILIEYTDEETKAIKECKRIADMLKEKYPNAKNEDYMQYAADYLISISTYKTKTYDMYQLLFENVGNCQAYTDCMDWIAKWLYIPDTQVNNQSINHTWNMFRGSDGQLWVIDATNEYKAVHKSSADPEKFRSIDYEAAELYLMSLEEKIIGYRDNRPKIPSTIYQTYNKRTDTSVSTGPAIIVSPTPTPTQEPTPTDILEPIPENTVNIGQKSDPGTIEIVDDDEGNLIVRRIYEPDEVHVVYADIGSDKIYLEFSDIKLGRYSIRYRTIDENWVTIPDAGTTGKWTLRYLAPNMVYYVQVKNVLYGDGGWNNDGEWSKVYKITTYPK
jgi:hypothetical protein